jgi:hypothetical protein
MKNVELKDSEGKVFFYINLKPKFSFLDKQNMFAELQGATQSINNKSKQNLKLFCNNIIKFCDE